MELLKQDPMITLAGQCALAYLVVNLMLKLVSILWRTTLASPINIKKKFGGKWALVTGSTDGIGQAYAMALAKSNMNIILVSRTQSKLDLTASQIVERYPSGNIYHRENVLILITYNSSYNFSQVRTFFISVQTRTIAVDFVNDDDTSYRLKIAREIEGL